MKTNGTKEHQQKKYANVSISTKHLALAAQLKNVHTWSSLGKHKALKGQPGLSPHRWWHCWQWLQERGGLCMEHALESQLIYLSLEPAPAAYTQTLNLQPESQDRVYQRSDSELGQ